jgi:hypothetical protein
VIAGGRPPPALLCWGHRVRAATWVSLRAPEPLVADDAAPPCPSVKGWVQIPPPLALAGPARRASAKSAARLCGSCVPPSVVRSPLPLAGNHWRWHEPNSCFRWVGWGPWGCGRRAVLRGHLRARREALGALVTSVSVAGIFFCATTTHLQTSSSPCVRCPRRARRRR